MSALAVRRSAGRGGKSARTVPGGGVAAGLGLAAGVVPPAVCGVFGGVSDGGAVVGFVRAHLLNQVEDRLLEVHRGGTLGALHDLLETVKELAVLVLFLLGSFRLRRLWSVFELAQ